MILFVNREQETELIGEAIHSFFARRYVRRTMDGAAYRLRRNLKQTCSRSILFDLNLSADEEIINDILEKVYGITPQEQISQEQSKSPFLRSTRKFIRKALNYWHKDRTRPQKKALHVTHHIFIKKKLRRRSQVKTASVAHTLSPDSSDLLDLVVICPIIKHIIKEEELYEQSGARSDRAC